MENYNEIDMFIFLERYKNNEIVYIPNPGNAGDAVIFYGTIQVFDNLNLKYTIGNINTIYNNKTIFYGGGGNLVGLYNNCYNFINKNKNSNNIVILPHTITNVDSLLNNVSENITFICREHISYDYVKKFIKNKNNLYLSKDLAFYINDLTKYKDNQGNGECNAFRTDIEKTKIEIPKDNIDLSQHFSKNLQTYSINVCKEVCFNIFEYLSKFSIINTNRLHIAIVGGLLNKKVNFYQNSYYKNKAIYDYSIKLYFPKTNLCD
jgi:exopolysaccharide biosynthesis predicted pyruvyltransferase EpsI